MNDYCPLAGKRALVTGSAKGIGRGIAITLARAGADVFLHYRSNISEAESLRKQIIEIGRKAYIVQADLSDDDELSKMFEEVTKTWSVFDIAVNNAGWDPGYIDFTAINPNMYRKLSDINIKGTLFCCLREIEIMRKNATGGSIINIGSVQQDTTVPGRTLYAMSKGAVHSLTGQLALECGPFGIRVNNIAPGYIAVERMSKAPEFDHDKVAADIPIGRLGQVDDVGELVAYLASDKAGFMTGQTLVLDGGVSRKLARSRPVAETSDFSCK